VLERVVVRAVVGDGHLADVGVAGAAHRRAAGGGGGGREAALEPAPADAPGGEQGTDVLPPHGGGRGAVAGAAGAETGGGGGERAGAAGVLGAAPAGRADDLPGRGQRGGAAGLAGDEVERPGGGRAELGVVEVVAHRVVLGVVPQPGHGVAVVVVHDQAG